MFQTSNNVGSDNCSYNLNQHSANYQAANKRINFLASLAGKITRSHSLALKTARPRPPRPPPPPPPPPPCNFPLCGCYEY